MADNKRYGGESHPGVVNYQNAPSNVQPYWTALITAISSEATPIKIAADPNTGRSYVFAEDAGQEVYLIPGPNGAFVDDALYTTMTGVVSSLTTMNPGDTRELEKRLKLKPTGVPGNPALVQRYLSEASKASVNNMRIAMSYKNKTIGELSTKPLSVVDQTALSIKTGDLTGGTRRSRSVSITQFSEGDAQAILEQFYTTTLGRRPTKKEVSTFKGLINAQAKKQPSTSTTTYGADGTSTTVSGGAGYSAADAQMAARKMAESDPEASAFLSSTRYLDAFMNAIGSQVSNG